MSDAPNPAQASTEADTIEVTDLDTCVKLFASWHANKLARIAHFLQLPDGQEVQVGNDPPFLVTGDTRKGFLLGINLALMEFRNLPFTYEMEDETPAAAANTADTTNGG